MRDFIIQAFVKGARCGNAHHCELEGSTAVFSKRRFRDRWNRTLVRQLARTRNHNVRVKARVRARGVTGHQYFNERRTELCRAKARTQQVWSLQLAGDWFPAYETKVPALRPHYMRVMLTANLAVQDRMANGTVVTNVSVRSMVQLSSDLSCSQCLLYVRQVHKAAYYSGSQIVMQRIRKPYSLATQTCKRDSFARVRCEKNRFWRTSTS